jgi:hypothetical protein
MVPVVKPTWVEASLKANKIKNPRTYSPDPAYYMSDIILCCGDLPSGDKEAIQGGVLAMGGQYSEVLSRTTTHLIALDLDDQRCQLAINKRLQVAIVLPHWFDDCLKVGRRISERPYTLPDPEILNVEAGAIPSTRTSQQIRDATTPDPLNDPIPQSHSVGSESPRGIKAFAGKSVKLGDDLGLNSRLKGVITSMIKSGGGNVTTELEETDIYVCKYRDGSDYVKASQDGKDVGNLSWLYYLIAHDVWTNPMRRMLHYPRPRNGVPGFEKLKISISSYTGEARVYLENLVRATGAEFTKTFKQDNTHLVTAHKNSEKCDAAQEWGVSVVNHLWLEESYAKCKMLPIADNRYTFFPPRTNLGEILGQTEIDRSATERTFFPKHKSSKPTPSSPVTKTKRTKTTEDAQTPLPSRHRDENETQTPGSRGAKDRAMTKIHSAAEDVMQFEKEMKRKGGVVHGGRRRTEDEAESQAAAKTKKTKEKDSVSKRAISEVEEEEESDDDTTELATKNKRAKKDKLAPIKHRMLVSKDERWTNDEKASKDKARLRELGLFITDDFKRVDLLCAPTVVRTKKFVAAMACGPTLVSSSYLDFAIKHNRLPPPEKHTLQAPDFEKEHGFRMSEAVERARQNKHRLLKDWTIFCTSSIAGGFDTYKDIIEANGGKCLDWKGKSTTATASKRLINSSAGEESQNQKEDEGDVLYLISDPDQKQFPNWVKFRQLAAKHDMIPRIVKTEWLLIVAMAQYVHWKKEWELTEDIVKSTKR